MFPNLLKSVSHKSRKQPPSSRPPRRRFAPQLEALETRTVPSYVFQTLDAPGAGTTGDGIQGTIAIGINAGGQISGNFGDANDVTHGYLLSHGQYSYFDDPSAGTGAGQGTNAYGLNIRGQIVGMYLDSSSVQHSFLRGSDGQFTTIDPPGASTTPSVYDEAVDINARGQIVGGYTDANGVTHGYLLSGGQYTTLDYPGATYTFGNGINAQGQIVGLYNDASGVTHGFLLSKGKYTSFDDPDGTATYGSFINDSGQITGYYLDANNSFHGFLLSNGKYTTVDDPNAGTGAYQGTFLFGITNTGKIVGGYLDGNNLYHGLVATPSGGDSANLSAADTRARGSSGGSANTTIADATLVNAILSTSPSFHAAGIGSHNSPFGENAALSTTGLSISSAASNEVVIPATVHDVEARDVIFSTSLQAALDPFAADLGLAP
jgi:probable HAF family extracellular repeat protein